MMKGGDDNTPGRQVYIISGDVRRNENQGIDIAKSTKDILVVDAETGKPEFIDISELESVADPVDAQQEIAAAEQEARQNTAQEIANKIDAVIEPVPEGVYEVADANGTHQIKVLADNGDGTLTVSLDGGEAQPMSRDQLQQMADTASMERTREKLGKTKPTEEGTPEESAAAGVQQEGAPQQAGQPETTVEAVPEGQPQQVAEVQAPRQETVDAMPMKEVVKVKGRERRTVQVPDWDNATPERAHKYIYDERGLEKEEADEFVENNRVAAEKELEEINGRKPKMGTDLDEYEEKRTAWDAEHDAAQRRLDYWTAVQKQQQDADTAAAATAAAERARKDAEAHDQAVLAEQARQAEELRKRREQEERGAGAVAAPIREKWDKAPKVAGFESEMVLPSGEKVSGRYMLVESGAATPSHNPNAEFVPNEGFPVDENGQSVNDRDYERDKDAQGVTRNMAQTYDGRAVQSAPVVSSDGVVLSGNGRTMAGELAAQQGTDGAYIEHLKKNGRQYGFTPEQVASMQHPRLVFVPDEAMPYTTETFAKFNAQEMKSQSKTEQAVKMGKMVDDGTFNRVVRGINAFNTLGEFYADQEASVAAINELRKAGVINEMQYAEMFDGEKVSEHGRQMLENMLIGKAFEGKPDAIRQLTEIPSLRQPVVGALAEIANNIALGEEYSLEDELAQAIDLAYRARKTGGVAAGKPVSHYARQMNLFQFDDGSTVADYSNATVMLLADIVNGSRKRGLKEVMQMYNGAARDSANGQMDLFSGTVKSKSDIIDEVKQLMQYGTEEDKQAAINRDAEQRRNQAAGSQSTDQAGTAGTAGPSAEGKRSLDINHETGGQPAGPRLSSEGNEYVEEGESPERWTPSEKRARNGEQFYQSEDGNIDLVDIPQEVFDEIGYTKAPFRLTPSMLKHVQLQHGKETKITNEQEAIKFITDIMKHFDHVRLGNDGALIFSIENGRKRTGRRAVTISLDSDSGFFYGIKTSGYEGVKRLERRPLLWERSADVSPSTDAATEPVTSLDAQRSGEQSGSASGQRGLSESKDRTNSANLQGNGEEKEAKPTLFQQYESEQGTVDKQGGLVKNEKTDGLLSEDWRGALHGLGRRIGRRIAVISRDEMQQRYGHGGIRGAYDKDDNTIYLNEAYVGDNESMRSFVSGHEVTHVLKDENPELWNAYVNAVNEAMGDDFASEFARVKNLYDNAFEEARKKGKKYTHLTDDDIAEEVCANWAGDHMLTDADAIRNVVEHAEQAGGDPVTLTQKVLDWIRERISALIGAKAAGQDVEEELTAMQRAEKLWQDMYDVATAKQNERAAREQALRAAAEQQPTENGEEVKFSVPGEEENLDGKDEQVSSPIQEEIKRAEKETETYLTDAQKEAGNYKKGHVRLDGFNISIENPRGSERSGRDAGGKEWSVRMNNDYGYIRGTEGVDGDHIDVFLSDHVADWNGMVYVVDQVKEDGTFDEHKVMYGFDSAEEARKAYLSNYSPGWKGLGTITGVSKDEFKKWVGSSHRKTKAFAEYKTVKAEEGQGENGGQVRFAFAKTNEEFDEMRDRAIIENGFVMPGLKDKDVVVVKVEKMKDGRLHPFNLSLNETEKKKAIKKYAVEHGLTGDVNVEGGVVYVSKNAIGQFADDKHIQKNVKIGINPDVYIAAILRIKDIIKNSVDCEIFPDRIEKDEKGSRNNEGEISQTSLMHVFYGAANIDEVDYSVKLLVKETKGSTNSKPYIYTLEEIELSDGHNDAVESGHTRKSDRTIPMTNVLKKAYRHNYPDKKLLEASAELDEQNKNEEIQNNQTSQNNGDNVSDSVGLNFGGGPDRGRVDLSDVKRYAQSVKVPKRITSQAQAVSWAYQALGGIRGMLSSLYKDRGSKDFSMGLLSMDPTKGREMDIDKALYSRGRVRQYLDIVQPKLYEARDNSTSEETRKFFQDLIDDCNYARQWYDRAAES